MKALILAAGYATRLYPLTLNTPKPLLKVGSRTLADRLAEKLEIVDEVDKIYIVTNEKFSGAFSTWARRSRYRKPIEVINDRTTANETRLGAVGDMALVIDKAGIADDLLVIGGDNLFDFDLRDFIKFVKAKKSNGVALRDVKDLNEAKKYGIVSLDEDSRVTEFIEKPKRPKSTLAAMCLYYFIKERLNLIKAYIEGGNNKDQPGHYISWLAKNDTVYGYKIEGEWFDIGDKRLLELADKIYKEREERR